MRRETSQSVFEVFSRVADVHAARPAIVSLGGEISYAELARRAAHVHATLAAQPRGDGGVGLHFTDPVDAIAAMLGVLRAGRFYVVLDPVFPSGRLRDIADDGAIGIVLSDDAGEAAARGLGGVAVERISWSRGAGEDAPPAAAVRADDFAYISYTSGSTGRPKGVMHPHANLLHEVAVHRWALHLGSGDRSALMYSPGVIGSVRDIFGMLLSGGAVCPFPFRQLGFRALGDWLVAQRVTQFHAVPVLYRELMRALKPDERLSAVRTVFLAGDKVERSDVALFARHFSPTASFYTGLGASEANSIYTHRFVDRGEADGGGPLPTGWSLPDKTALVLDGEHRELPPGVRGEIAVRSRYLANGYWRRPELSAKVFLGPADCRDERIYLTGDHGFFDELGRLVHLGRGDRQVKINGERIELGEIESALREEAGVRAARVRVIDDLGARPRLIAYVEARASDFDEVGTRASLARRLSPTARPAVIHRLDAFPLNANGKLDEAALPQVSEADVPVESPAATEEQGDGAAIAAALWRELFPDEAIRWDATLEQSGGDSLHAVRLACLLKERAGVDWPVSLAPREVTPRRLARLIDSRGEQLVDPALAQIAGVLALWRLSELGETVSAAVPVVRVGQDRGATPIIWVGQKGRGLEIGRALAADRLVYLVPALVPMGRSEAREMANSYRLLSRRLAPHLAPAVDLGGCCNSGWLAMILGRELQQLGIGVENVFVLDAFGSRLAHECFFQLSRVQIHAARGFGAFAWRLWFLARMRLRKFAPAKTFGEATRSATPPTSARITGALLPEVTAEGVPLRVGLSAGTSWLSVIFPRLGWRHLQRGDRRPKVFPGEHWTLWEPEGCRRIVEWVATVSPGKPPEQTNLRR